MKYLRLVTSLFVAVEIATSARAGGVTSYIASPPINAIIGANRDYVIYGDPVQGSITFTARNDQGGDAYDLDSEFVDGNFSGYEGDAILATWQVTDDNGAPVGTLDSTGGPSVKWTPGCPGTFVVTMTVTNPSKDENGSSAIDPRSCRASG